MKGLPALYMRLKALIMVSNTYIDTRTQTIAVLVGKLLKGKPLLSHKVQSPLDRRLEQSNKTLDFIAHIRNELPSSMFCLDD